MHYGPPQPQPQPRPRAGMPTGAALGLAAATLVVGFFGGCTIGVLSASTPEPATAEPAPSVSVSLSDEFLNGPSSTPSAEPTPTKTKPSVPTIEEGTYRVPQDVKPGTYRTSGSTDGYCYWARLRNLSGGLEGIIANGNPGGPTVVTIRSTDKGFETRGCADWKKIG